MNHSPEPWTTDSFESGGYIADADGNPVAYQDDYEQLTREDAERIVACVNFCRGIPTDVLLRRGNHDEYRVEHLPCWGLKELKVVFSELNQVVVTIDKTGEILEIQPSLS
jgi:hypothetical protein